jgi:hypothetical protein
MNSNLLQITFQVTPTPTSTIPLATTAPTATTVPAASTVPNASAPTLPSSTIQGAGAPTTLAPVTTSPLIQLNPTGSTTVVATTLPATGSGAQPTTAATVPSQTPLTETTPIVSPVAEAGTGELAFTGPSIELALIGIAFVLTGAVVSITTRRHRKRA